MYIRSTVNQFRMIALSIHILDPRPAAVVFSLTGLQTVDLLHMFAAFKYYSIRVKMKRIQMHLNVFLFHPSRPDVRLHNDALRD